MILYLLIGLIGGVLSGMGMGGGTILIPLLTTFLGVAQKQAQFLNIFSFVFMSVFIVTINIKQKMIDPFPAVMFSIPGIIGSVISSFLIKGISESFLKITFGLFLIVLAIIQLIVLLSKNKSNKNWLC